MSSETTPRTTANVKVPSRNMVFSKIPAIRLLSFSKLTPAAVQQLHMMAARQHLDAMYGLSSKYQKLTHTLIMHLPSYRPLLQQKKAPNKGSESMPEKQRNGGTCESADIAVGKAAGKIVAGS